LGWALLDGKKISTKMPREAFALRRALLMAFAIADSSGLVITPLTMRRSTGILRTFAEPQMQNMQDTRDPSADVERLAALDSIQDEIDQDLYSWKRDQIMSSGAAADDECEVTEEKNMLQQIKDLGAAGALSYALWELGFWTMSVPIGVFGFYQIGNARAQFSSWQPCSTSLTLTLLSHRFPTTLAVGRWPDFNDTEDMAKLGAEAFAFVNLARFAVPLRLGLAISTAPWIKDNIIDRLFPPKEPKC
jgi:hypothetical protein